MIIFISLGLTIFDNLFCQLNFLSFLTWISIFCHLGAYYLIEKSYEGYEVRAAMVVPILLMQLNMLTVYDALFITCLLPTFLFDLVLVGLWKIHIVTTVVQTLLIAILVRFSLFNPSQNGYENIGSLSSFTYFSCFIIIITGDILLFYYFENIVSSNLLISVTQKGRGKTIEAFGRISRHSRNPNALTITIDSVNDDSYAPDSHDGLSYQSQSQTPQDKNTTIQSMQPQTFEDFNNKASRRSPKSVDSELDNVDSNDKYVNYITKKFKSDHKEVLSFYNEGKHQKEIMKLLESHASEISSQFHSNIESLEDEIVSTSSSNSPQIIAVKKTMLMKLVQTYFKFLGIENILKLQCKKLTINDEFFALKNQLFYSTDFYVSIIQSAKVFIKIHPNIPDEVKGDVMKLKEILTHMFSFIFRCSKNINLEVDLDDLNEPELTHAIFNFSFMPSFDIKEEALMILNDSNANMFIFDDRNNKNKGQTFLNTYDKVRDTVCISFMMIPALIKSMKGSIRS
jgi:hypothetical protein